MIDLRSDTVTRPSPVMRRAMAEAEVGDDVFDDDPTVHRLQERAAEATGKEAALYTVTGTMANQTALRTFVHTGHQVGGGTVFPLETLRDIRAVTGEAGLPLYMDGARIWNASVASGVPVPEYADQVDAMMFCFSKGLGAPIGSILCGPADFIAEARRVRGQFPRGWRQAGVIAAAALVALQEGPKRLHEDHANARRLAGGIAEIP